jgi:hypothetical protein
MRSHCRIEASWTNARVVGREFVVAGCHTPTVIDLVEEPFKQISALP